MAKRVSRSKGRGHLEKRGGVWRVRWMVDGRTFTRSTGTGDRREAERIAADIMLPFQAQTDADRARALVAQMEGRQAEVDQWRDEHAAPLKDAFQLYRDSPSRPNRADPATMDRYEAQFGDLVAWLAKNAPDVHRLNQVTEEHAAAFVAELKRTRTPNTVNKRVTLFRSIWEHLCGTARLTDNPWRRVRKLQLETHTRRALTADELARVCRPLTGELRTLFAVAIYTGLRMGDAVSLAWESVDLLQGVIVTTPHKTRKHNAAPVVIPIHPALAAVLNAVDAPRRGPVMPGLRADYERDPPAVSKRVQAAFRAAGVETHGGTYASGRAMVDAGLHALRHSFVTLAANAGASLDLVKSLVGHTTAGMTEHYHHADRAALAGVVATLPDVLADQSQDAPSPPSSPRLDRLRDLLLEMDAQELAQAAEIVRNAQKTGRMVE